MVAVTVAKLMSQAQAGYILQLFRLNKEKPGKAEMEELKPIIKALKSVFHNLHVIQLLRAHSGIEEITEPCITRMNTNHLKCPLQYEP